MQQPVAPTHLDLDNCFVRTLRTDLWISDLIYTQLWRDTIGWMAELAVMISKYYPLFGPGPALLVAPQQLGSEQV